jgi:hypothetical protein
MVYFLCKLFVVLLVFELRASSLLRQVLYHLSHTCSPFCFSYFSDRSQVFCPGWPGPKSSYYASCIGGMIGVYHHAWLFYWDGVSITFLGCGTRSWTQDLALVRQALYYLSHVLRPFWVVHLLYRVSFYALAGLDCDLRICASQCSWNDRHFMPPCPAIGWDGVLWTFCPLNLCLQSSCDYRHKPCAWLLFCS